MHINQKQHQTQSKYYKGTGNEGNKHPVAITIYNSEKEIDIVASYRKPGLKWNKQNWINLFNNKRKNVDTIFIGDYNAKSPLWNCVNTNGDGRILEEVLMESNLFIGNFDTISRIGDERSNPSNIDLFITTMNIIGKSQYRNTGEQWGSLYHFILEMKLFDNIIHCNKKKGNKKPYNDVTMNWPKFREIIESKLNYIIDEIGNRVQKYEQTIQDSRQIQYIRNDNKRSYYQNPRKGLQQIKSQRRILQQSNH